MFESNVVVLFLMWPNFLQQLVKKKMQIDFLFRFSRGPSCGGAPRQTWRPPHSFHNTLRRKHHWKVLLHVLRNLDAVLSLSHSPPRPSDLPSSLYTGFKILFLFDKTLSGWGPKCFFWCAAPSWDVHTFQMVCCPSSRMIQLTLQCSCFTEISGLKSCTSTLPSSKWKSFQSVLVFYKSVSIL